jgi:hypothetical protein
MVRPVKVESPDIMYDKRFVLKLDMLDNVAQKNGMDNRIIAGEMRVILLVSNVSRARMGDINASPSAVLESLKKRSKLAVIKTIRPDARRREPGQPIS